MHIKFYMYIAYVNVHDLVVVAVVIAVVYPSHRADNCNYNSYMQPTMMQPMIVTLMFLLNLSQLELNPTGMVPRRPLPESAVRMRNMVKGQRLMNFVPSGGDRQYMYYTEII